jgi:antitoxin component YwqK of YwqJK toxin-antitoxin module
MKTDSLILPVTDTFKIECDVPNIKSLIVRNDTTVNRKNYIGHIIKSFDSKNRLLKVFVSNLYESNVDKIYSSTSVYDTAGHVIYEDKTEKFIRFHCYSYKYDLNGHIISKIGYSSGEIGIKVSYIYEGGKLIKEITERPGQKTEKTY